VGFSSLLSTGKFSPFDLPVWDQYCSLYIQLMGQNKNDIHSISMDFLL
jgi:hypothetical protein